MGSELTVENKSSFPADCLDVLVDRLRPRLHELLICLSNSWGGLEQVVVKDAINHHQLGLKTSVMCLTGSPVHERLLRHPEIRLRPLDFRPRDYFDFKLKKELHRALGEGVNLIHCHQTSLLGSIIPWVWGWSQVAVFASRHIMNNHDKKDFFHRAIYSRLDSLIVMSEVLRQNVLDTHSLGSEQVQVINLGVDFDRFDPQKVEPEKQRLTWGADRDTVVIGLVGRIDPAKGQAVFIKAAAGLLQHVADRVKLKFIMVGEQTLGDSSTHLAELKDMVKQFRLDDSVVFAGYQENIPEVMRAFDILVMPSRQEAFGLVAIEAMAMECPVVISNGGSAAEIVGEQEYGLLVRPEDAFDLQRQLRYLLDHSEERIQMGKRARDHVRRHYDRRLRLLKTLELYENTLRKRSKN